MSDEQADNKPQVTAPTATAPRLKNPKRVEAGKLNAEKTRKAREAQKKALAEAEAKIANYEAKRKDAPEPDDGTTVNAVPPPPPKESVYWEPQPQYKNGRTENTTKQQTEMLHNSSSLYSVLSQSTLILD